MAKKKAPKRQKIKVGKIVFHPQTGIYDWEWRSKRKGYDLVLLKGDPKGDMEAWAAEIIFEGGDECVSGDYRSSPALAVRNLAGHIRKRMAFFAEVLKRADL